MKKNILYRMSLLILLLIKIEFSFAQLNRACALYGINCYKIEDRTGSDECWLAIYIDGKKVDSIFHDCKVNEFWMLRRTYRFHKEILLKLWEEDKPSILNDTLGAVLISTALRDTTVEFEIYRPIDPNHPKPEPPRSRYTATYRVIGEPKSKLYEVFKPAQLRVSIQPQAVVDAGAKFRLNDGEWMDSNVPLFGIKPGEYTLSFKSIGGWDKPNDISICIPGGSSINKDVIYDSIPYYKIGTIPSQLVWHGNVLIFNAIPIVEELKDSISIIANPQPKGKISFNNETHIFRYSPAPEDKEEFSITFHDSINNLQTISVLPMKNLKPEADIFKYTKPLPDPESRDYIIIHESINTSEEELNNLPVGVTYNITIAGPTIIIENGSIKNDLYEIYNERQDIKEMKISAENVVIRSPFHLPQTKVTINARSLKFEDPQNGKAGSAHICTTPTSIETIPDTGDGIPGLKAGDIILNIDYLSSEYNTDYNRLILCGGKGQPASLGHDGADGGGGTIIRTKKVSGVDVVWRKKVFGGSSFNPNIEKWPEDGKDATSAGRPGSGGSGGDLHSTLSIDPIVDNREGLAGVKGPYNKGGRAQEPKFSYGYIHYVDKPGDGLATVEQYIWYPGAHTSPLEPHESKDGASFWPPDPVAQIGEKGSIIADLNQQWLDPLTMETIISYIRDVYINGHYNMVESLCNKYMTLIDEIEETASPDLLDYLDASKQEIASLRLRVVNKLDYFGYPAGWTPMLSFEANKTAFNREIDKAIPLLYLTYWLGEAAKNAKNDKEAMMNTLKKIKTELPDEIEQYNKITESLSGLITKRDNLMGAVNSLEYEISSRENELLATAENNLKKDSWKMGLRIIGSILKVIPVAQPSLGAIGTGMDFMSNLNTNKPLMSLWESSDILLEFDPKELKKSSKDFYDQVKKIQNSGYSDIKKDINTLKVIGNQFTPAFNSIQKTLKDREVPQSKIQAELEKLKASDPVYLDLIQQVQEFTHELQLYVERIAQTTSELNQLSSNIYCYLLTMDAVQKNLSSVMEKLNPNALAYIEMMERRTKDRLLKYQYYVSKAYNYRMLQPYDGDLNLNRLFESFITIAKDNNDSIPEDKFELCRNVYEEELRRITGIIFDELNAKSPERSVPISFGLTKEEISQLNKENIITINLKEKGIFGKSEENFRIVNLSTNSLTVHPSNGTYQNTAILRVTILHGGKSQLLSNGNTYNFQHYMNESSNPITWKTVYDGINGSFVETKPSAAYESLIRYLLGTNEINDILLYSRPAAWADLIIKKEVSTDNGIDMVIDDLRFTVEYDYFEKPLDKVELDVEVLGDLNPNIFLNVADINGRQDGRGDFNRFYNKNQKVTLRAQPKYGEWEFEKWLDAYSNTIIPNTPSFEIELILKDYKKVYSVYRFIGN